ncbi:MAG: heat-inducible transcriptional repressor HrcA [Rothia sp. (in: high G+C Gram-positive bacteria)]|nr:heat-inducible transcriptional repressor HrcA [Rothia sp. (in: high G+C Gram-positive bacteria)]
MNQPRRLKVLQAIVEDYVHLREPVGSKALIERHGLGVSSATVRNDMAALEEAGLIQAPHASAGRVPTDKGYRLFVDRVAQVKPLSAAEKRAIKTLLDSAEDIDEMMSRSARLLSNLTQQVAMVQYPQPAVVQVRHIELVTLSPALLLVVLITSTGQVLQRNVSAAHTEETLSDTKQLVNQKYAGQPLHLLTHQGAPAGQNTLLSQVLESLRILGAQSNETRLLVAGTAYLVEGAVDFSGSIAPVLDALEEQVVLLKLLTSISRNEQGFAVSIGQENSEASLAETAVIAHGYGPDEVAQLGVVGPTRMDYSMTMSKVNAVARYLSKVLNDG